MNLQPPQIGNEEFDNDAKQLFELASDPDRLKAAQEAARDTSLSFSELTARIPESIIRIVMALNEDDVVTILNEKCPEDQRAALDEARKIATEQFSGLLRHPEVVSEMRKAFKRTDRNPLDAKNVIARIAWEPLWDGRPPKLSPAARVSFLDEADQLLLDSTLDLDDLSFTIRALAKILARQFELSIDLANAKLLDTSAAKELGKRIRDTREYLDQVVEIARGLCMDLGWEHDENSQESTHEAE